MKLIHALCVLAFASLSVSLPVDARANTKVTAASVKTAAANFAKDANTVSSSINTMGDTTDSKKLKSLATTAFAAESDEVLFENYYFHLQI
jgi:hypothetical protein